MTSEERKEARYQRRKASRQKRREERLKEYDDFDRVKDANNLITAFKKSKSGVDWKASVQQRRWNPERMCRKGLLFSGCAKEENYV